MGTIENEQTGQALRVRARVILGQKSPHIMTNQAKTREAQIIDQGRQIIDVMGHIARRRANALPKITKVRRHHVEAFGQNRQVVSPYGRPLRPSMQEDQGQTAPGPMIHKI